jgi:hypothetical protein
MDEQNNNPPEPTPIMGYRNLSETDRAIINKIKTIANQVGIIVNLLEDSDMSDPYWVEIARVDLQKGFMSLVRAVAQPDGF